jgi:O-antigen ligase
LALTSGAELGYERTQRATDAWEPWRFCVLLAFFGILFLNVPALQASRDNEALVEGSPLNQALWVVLLVFAVLTIQESWPRVRYQFTPSLLVVLVWMILTIPSAIMPDISLRRYIFSVIVIVITVICVSSPRDDQAFIKAFMIVSMVEIGMKYLFVVAVPSLGLHGAEVEPQLAGLWRGHHVHKNQAAAICATQIFVFFALRRRIPWLYLAVPAVLDTVFLINAGSKTSLGLIVISMVLATLISRVGRFLAAPLVLGTLLAAAAITVLSIYSAAMQSLTAEMFGDATYTGRTDLWRFLIAYSADHPWFGSGFQSLWKIGAAAPALQDGRTWLTLAPHGHQGYLDLMATIGVPGLVFACLFLVGRPLSDLAYVQQRKTNTLPLYVACWIFGLLHNFTETSVFDRAYPVWVFMLIGICGIRRARANELASAEPLQSESAVPATDQRRSLHRH